jgi:hypothetical protein
MTTTLKLSDSQLVLLSTASRRDDGLLVRPKYLRRNALDKLTRAGLIEPVIVTTDDPVWHEDDENVRHGYRITSSGLCAIGIEPEIRIDTSAPDAASPPAGSAPCDVDARGKILTTLRTGSKRALVLSLLQQEQGASLADLMQATGWLAHTTRAALSGLRTRGTVIERIQAVGEPSRYRVNASPLSGLAAATDATAEGPVNGAGA